MKWLVAIIEGLVKGLFGARRDSEEYNNIANTVPTDTKTKKTVSKLRDKINRRIQKES